MPSSKRLSFDAYGLAAPERGRAPFWSVARMLAVAGALLAMIGLKPLRVCSGQEESTPPAQGAASKSAEVKPDVPQTLAPLDRAAWIWATTEVELCHFRKTIVLDEAPSSAHILITADNGFHLYVNGTLVGSEVGAAADIWQSVERYDITSQLARGRNVIGIRGTDLGGQAGLVAAVRIEFKDRTPLEIVTDAGWRVTTTEDPTEFAHPEYVEGPGWQPARVLGQMGMTPWGKLTFSTTPRPRTAAHVELAAPGPDFRWPGTIAFLADDCSVYVPLRGDAWGVCFRVGDWSRAYTEFDLPCPSKIGRKLYRLDATGPGAKPKLLFDAGTGCIGSPSVSYDGRSILVAMARAGEKFFHIYRVPADGTAPQRLTDGPFHDIDPVELPDGRIAFASTRIGTFEEYHNPPSRALFVMNTDGGDIHPITHTLIFDNEPKVAADGRLAFIRTDNFFDRGKVETQIHAVRPDGTDGFTEVGAEVGADYGVRLRAFGYGSPAPLPDGRLAVISNRGNFICTPGVAESSFHRLPDSLGDLAPLPDGRLLATVIKEQGKQTVSDVIGVIDPRDNRIVRIHDSTVGSVHSPVFLGPRPRPPVVPETVDRARADGLNATGFLFCENARFTTKTKADWSQVRAIRVLGAVPLTVRSSHSHIVHAGHQTVELGTVPIAPDGSFYVEVPADMPLALQAVDAEGRSELNEMSWIYVRPGERRSCLGCHHPRRAAPPTRDDMAQALGSPPLRLLGQGRPHRFRGNNSGVTGMMDLQFERFRETASINRHMAGDPMATGRQDIAALVEQLRAGDESRRISAAQRLAVFRDRSAAAALAERLRDPSRELRVAVATALAACGRRDSVPPLLDALADAEPLVAQAAAVALECVSGHAEPFDPFATLPVRQSQVERWRGCFAADRWETIEQSLIERLAGPDPAEKRRAAVALGHIGGDAACAALRQFVQQEITKNPYPPFEQDNRTDRFTFSADSPLNPRTLQAAVRSLGHLEDGQAVPLLAETLGSNIEPRMGNLFLAEAAIEALGRIGTPEAAHQPEASARIIDRRDAPSASLTLRVGVHGEPGEAETALIDTFAQLKEYWQYVGWYSDHPALYACHASPLYARIIVALDALGSTQTGSIVPHVIRSVPTDPDRALLPENDDYETLAGRVIRRSGRGDEVIETCLALLGDAEAKPSDEIKTAITTTAAAWGGKPGPENRAAQVLSLVCRDRRYEPRVRAAFERFRALPEEPVKRQLGNPNWTPVRHWVLFYLARSLGNLADPESVDTLIYMLGPDLNEARHGRPDPSQPEIHFLQLEYTPCWRAAAAWALGAIGDKRAVPTLLAVVANLDNATDVRHAAATALGQIADPASLAAIENLAKGYPEISTRRALARAAAKLTGQELVPGER